MGKGRIADKPTGATTITIGAQKAHWSHTWFGPRVMTLQRYGAFWNGALRLVQSLHRLPKGSRTHSPNMILERLTIQRGGSVISDYTVLPVGTSVEGGVVRVCPKCRRHGLHIEMDGHGFYTHSQVISNDDPRSQFIRRVECHLLPSDRYARTPVHELRQLSAHSTQI